MANLKSSKKSAKSLKPKGQYRHGDLKRVLVLEAIKLIESRRDVHFTLRELSQAAGVTHAAAYRHFRSKREILAQIALEGFTKMQEYFDDALKTKPSQRTGPTKALAMSYVFFATQNQAHFRVMFHPELKDMDEFPELVQVSMGTFETLVRCMAENQASGRYIERPLKDFTLAAWSIVHGLSTLLINDNFSGPLAEEKHDLEHSAEVVASFIETGFLRR